MTTTDTVDLFAGIRPRVPTRYAPGDTHEPYPYPKAGDWDVAVWYPVIYYPVGEVVPGEGPIWLVEPYPAARADGTDGQDPIDGNGGAGVAVLRGSATPSPRGKDADGDWTIPGRALAADSAYDVFVEQHADLMAAWCEAYAIAEALNNGVAQAMGLKPDDIEVLLAAERGALTSDSRVAGTIDEMRWPPIAQGQQRAPQRVPVRQAKRLRKSLAAIVIASTDGNVPPRPGFSASDPMWAAATYRLTGAGAGMLDTIRRQYTGPARCRVCGCTEEQPCPRGCAWVPDPQLADLCSECTADDPEAALRP